MAELNQWKVPRRHKNAELILNFPILAHLKFTQQTFAKKKKKINKKTVKSEF